MDSGSTFQGDPTAFVAFRDVSKTYDGERLAVARLNLSIGKGEFMTFLGPSGSGKTTALMMLAGFEAPTVGDIILNGRSLSQTPPHRRNMGVVFQNYALFPHMTVAQNVAFPLGVRKTPAAEAASRVADALEMVRLSSYENRRPNQLSGGQQQRVALARALVFDPDIVLMDEPLGALDRQLREQLQVEIKHIQRRLGVTVVYVTHDQSEALTMSDRIAVFHEGQVRQVDRPDDLYERPMNAFTAGFVGENNRIGAVVERVGGGECRARMNGGLEVQALAIGSVAAGDRASLWIRPERIVLGAPEDIGPNRYKARVEDLIYHGDHTRVRVSLPCGVELLTRAPERGGEAPWTRGDEVWIGWAARDCRAFPDQEA